MRRTTPIEVLNCRSQDQLKDIVQEWWLSRSALGLEPSALAELRQGMRCVAAMSRDLAFPLTVSIFDKPDIRVAQPMGIAGIEITSNCPKKQRWAEDLSSRHYAESGTSAVYWDDPAAPASREEIVEELSPWNPDWHLVEESNEYWVSHTARTIMEKARKRASYTGCTEYWLWVQDRETSYRSVDRQQVARLLERVGSSVEAFTHVFIETTLPDSLRDSVVWRIGGGRVQTLKSEIVDAYFPDRTLIAIRGEIEELIRDQSPDAWWYISFRAAIDCISRYYLHRLHCQPGSHLDAEDKQAIDRLSEILHPPPAEEWSRQDGCVRPKALRCLEQVSMALRDCASS